jgi:protein-S-isoprenylcysteine O-methyltransferase Ste14
MNPDQTAPGSSLDQDNPHLPVLPPVLPFAALLLAVAGEWLVPLHFLQDPAAFGWQFWLGAVLFALGFLSGAAGMRAFREAGTNVEPYKPALLLVTSGPYRVTRNPMYVGFVLMLAGLSLALALEWGLILVPALWLALDRMIVVREERYLTAKFGSAYTDFQARTRRWL